MENRVGFALSKKTPVVEKKILQKLEQSPFYRTYSDAFEAATGLKVSLVGVGPNPPKKTSAKSSAFCREINGGGAGCDRCRSTQKKLMASSSEKADTATCFAGLRETLVPVKSGNRCYAYLAVGEVRVSKGDEDIPVSLKGALDEMGFKNPVQAQLVKLWRETPVVERDQYQGAVTLLAAFALQLSDLLNRIMTEEANAEPDAVVKARHYVNANLEERISLEDVANHAGVSPYHFCKLFKQAVGMTLTEYVNRRRIEWAKRELSNSRASITEVAFAVGFQSISQFNRSFLKYAGSSPTAFRNDLASKVFFPEMAEAIA